mgnify:CR=1 FL=1
MNKSFIKAIGLGLFSVLAMKSYAGGGINPSFTATTVCQGGSTVLVSTSTTSSGNLVAWNWDLDNDGQFDDATGQSVVYIFPSSGTFPVNLQVISDVPETTSTTLNVIVNPLPNASFSANDDPYADVVPSTTLFPSLLYKT